MSGPSTHLQFVPARVLSSFRYDGLAIGKEEKPTSTENRLLFVR